MQSPNTQNIAGRILISIKLKLQKVLPAWSSISTKTYFEPNQDSKINSSIWQETWKTAIQKVRKKMHSITKKLGEISYQ